MPLLLLRLILLASFVAHATAVPWNVSYALQPRVHVPALEWTAWGDSFASGIGAGDLVEWGECWRFTGAYSKQLNAVPVGGKLPGAIDARKLNHCACSGSTTAIALATQFRKVGVDPPITDPHWGFRPTVGQPRFGTLTIGGVDVQFPEILRSCIYDLGPIKPCEEQLSDTWQLLRAPELVTVIEQVINTAIRAGRKQYWGSRFKLYVTGYNTFFNADTEICSNRTFSIWGQPSKNALLLTKELRHEFSRMTAALNIVIQQAVARQAPYGASYVDWQKPDALAKHRFCEPTVVEPDKNREDTWFFHLSHICDTPTKWCDALCRALDHHVKSCKQLQIKYKTDPMSMARGRDNALWDPLSVLSNDSDVHVAMLSEVGRIFHPTYEAHTHIRDVIEGMLDLEAVQIFAAPPVIATNVTLPKPTKTNVVRPTWMLSRYVSDTIAPSPTPTSASAGTSPSAPAPVFTSISPSGIAPLPKPQPAPSSSNTVPPASMCVGYKFWFTHFEILGSFAGPAIGQDDQGGVSGLGLLEQLRGCGSVTQWHFDSRYNASDYAWQATGRLPVTFRTGCVRRAIHSAGGPKVNMQGCYHEASRNSKRDVIGHAGVRSDAQPRLPSATAHPNPGSQASSRIAAATTAFRGSDEDWVAKVANESVAIGMDNETRHGEVMGKMTQGTIPLHGSSATAKAPLSIPSSLNVQVATLTRSWHALPAQVPPPAPKHTEVREPTVKRYDTHWDVWYTDFEIIGANFSEPAFQRGEGLRQWVKRCGTLTYWEMYLNENDKSFVVRGRLPVFTAHRLTQAIGYAGGPKNYGRTTWCSGIKLFFLPWPI